ncbi:MAG TPA: histidine--tRNA ligase [Holosporales bacterium]|nr:histidine--tRNA ligase [Holosporales bacterium]
MIVNSPRGTRDILGQEAKVKAHILKCFYDCVQTYNFNKIETPIFEHTSIFKRTLGEASDIVGKEMYTFNDKGSDSLTLRPEGTAPIVRALISNGLTQNLPQKLCYVEPMFRYERPQKGRYRQFVQAGIEYIGSNNPLADVECIALAHRLLNKLDVKNTTLYINTLGDIESRQAYRKALVDYFTPLKNKLSLDSQFRLQNNPLRILDSKDPEDKLLCVDAPQYQLSLNQTSKDFFSAVLKGLDALDIPYTIQRSLVRGLDYYCHTAFEFKTDQLGAQDAIIAGGRYDHLVKQMGGPDIAAVGCGIGIDRLCLLMENIPLETPPIIGLLPVGEDEFITGLKMADRLRKNAINIEFPLNGNMGKRFKQLDKAGCSHAVIFGADELAVESVTVKNLQSTDDQTKEETVKLYNLAAHLKKICGL